MKEILPKPAMKILNKLTVKKICNFLWFNPDKSIQNILAKDLGIELVRNIFIGNEPYVKGTAVYEAFEKLINRLSLIIHIAEKKALKLPKKITNVIHCKNPRCITSIEQELPHIFYLSDEKTETYRCQYCEEKYSDFK